MTKNEAIQKAIRLAAENEQLKAEIAALRKQLGGGE